MFKNRPTFSLDTYFSIQPYIIHPYILQYVLLKIMEFGFKNIETIIVHDNINSNDSTWFHSWSENLKPLKIVQVHAQTKKHIS